ncbi:MAG: NifB/NifX family molybdenum-iron cluster-binding protein [Deltaproteobacteria bacterium]|jgi:nitrogen fixation protein NifX
MRIAIVSTNGRDVNEHFGKASRFLIYELGETGLVPIEERPVEPLYTGDLALAFDSLKFDEIVRTIGDCQRVYVTKIGPRPSVELDGAGITTVLYNGPISEIRS